MTYITPQQPQAPATNGMGLAGFIISLIGWLTCGVLCPIGLIFSAIGMRKEPRGMAIAGFVIGLLGTIIYGVIFAFYGLALFSLFSCLSVAGTAAKQRADTFAAI